MIPENVKKVFEEHLWFVSTYGEEPNVVPVGFKCITSEDKLAIGAILLDTTLENIAKNGKVAIAAANPLTAEAYQIKGSAKLVKEGEAYDHYVKLAEDTFNGAYPLKYAVVITPEKLITATPNQHNKKEIPLKATEKFRKAP